MCTGDAQATAVAVAAAVGIPLVRVTAQASPADKQRLVAHLQGQTLPSTQSQGAAPSGGGGSDRGMAGGRRVAFVGDGTNDAAAMAQVRIYCARSWSQGGGVAYTHAFVLLLTSPPPGPVVRPLFKFVRPLFTLRITGARVLRAGHRHRHRPGGRGLRAVPRPGAPPRPLPGACRPPSTPYNTSSSLTLHALTCPPPLPPRPPSSPLLAYM
jgi:hypothetical protein